MFQRMSQVSVSAAVFSLPSEICRGDLFQGQKALYVYAAAVLITTLSVLQRAADCIETMRMRAFSK